MLSPDHFIEGLVSEGITRFTGVPCSFFQAAINRVLDDPDLSYTIVPNEGAALALASGSSMAGAPCAVLIQNSGFGNLINPLTSLNLIYGIPVLIFMSGRAYGVADEPQHEIIGSKMVPILDALEVPHADLPADDAGYRKALKDALKTMRGTGKPFVFLVRKGCIDEYRPKTKPPAQWPLTRIEAIRLVAACLDGSESVVATTGKPSRELFSVADRQGNFYMQGSMGHAASIGLGIALARPSRRVLVLDGDGAVLMHMGILSAIGHYKPSNLIHVTLDNESYETTGDQDTTSPTTDFAAIAKASGYVHADDARNADELREKLGQMLAKEGPAFLRVKINRTPTDGIPRISEKYTSKDIARRFSEALKTG